jgi:hypothetical protein
MAGGWYLKLTFYFTATTHEPLYLEERSFFQWKMVDIPTSSVLIIILFNRLLNMAMVGFSNYWGGRKIDTSRLWTLKPRALPDP